MGYAEMFEWADRNPNGEDRSGLAVINDGFEIRIAEGKDQPIGVTAGDNTSVAVISGLNPYEWHGKHLRDPMNRLLWEDQVMVEWVDNGYRHWYEADRIPEGIVVPIDATYYRGEWNGHKLKREILSPEYLDPVKPGARSNPYVARSERHEWAIVVILGRAVMRKDQIIYPRWRKLRSIPGKVGGVEVEEWLIR